MKKKLRFNIDRLKICYKQPSGLFEHLSTFSEGDSALYGEAGEFGLTIIDDGRGTDGDREATEITAAVVLNHDGREFGRMRFNGAGKYNGLCFLEVANSRLYEKETFGFLGYIEGCLSLEVNSLTQVDLAADVNFNPVPKIRKLIKDYAHFDMIANGKRIENEHRTIEHYGEFYSRSREKLNRMPTLYFSQAMSDGLKLRVYNKAKEIAESSGKTYITEANGFDGYRMEVTVRWEQFRQWLDFVNSAADGLVRDDWRQRPTEDYYHFLGRSLYSLDDEEFRSSLWRYCADRLIYFRRIDGRKEVVSLLDIAVGDFG